MRSPLVHLAPLCCSKKHKERKEKSPLDEAMSQLVYHHYYEKFQSCGLSIIMVGVNFDSEKGRIDGWKEIA